MRLPILLTAFLVLAACSPQAETPTDEVAQTAVAEEPVMPADAPPQEDVVAPVEAASTSCNLDEGADAALALAQRCVAVSPATHPPCNPVNPCQMIQDEIDRACAQYPAGEKPAECAA